MIKRTHLAARGAVLILALSLIATTFGACDFAGASVGKDPAIVSVSVYYFQTFYVPNLNEPPNGPSSPLECIHAPDPSDWFALVVATGIKVPSTATTDFQFNAANFQPLGPGIAHDYDAWTAYLDPYWSAQSLDVAPGQSLDSSKVHQGVFFLLSSVQGGPGTAIPALYQGAVLTQNQGSPETISPPDSAQPYASPLQTQPLVIAGSC